MSSGDVFIIPCGWVRAWLTMTILSIYNFIPLYAAHKILIDAKQVVTIEGYNVPGEWPNLLGFGPQMILLVSYINRGKVIDCWRFIFILNLFLHYNLLNWAAKLLVSDK